MNKGTIMAGRFIVVLFYAVGIAGVLIDATRPIFVLLIPFALLFNAIILFVYKKAKFGLKEYLAFVFVFLAGFGIEVLGVHTGVIFGLYSYGNSLGFKLFDVPLIIGVNWLVLSYSVADLFARLRLNILVQSVLGALALVLFDLFLEIAAPALNMWSWMGNQVPVQNYLAWFVLSFVFILLFKMLRVKTRNPLSAVVFFSQLIFFLILALLKP
ncbi:MAG: carotenoid biosynthesis protein [Bacteroidales bacterium]|nr:carotenoid biosynthesis protein [Bacteroidales bacterium]